MKGRKINPIVKPIPLPKAFAISFDNINPKITLTSGINISIIHHIGFFTICNKTITLKIGMIHAQPGCPAFTNTFHTETIIRTKIIKEIIQISKKENPNIPVKFILEQSTCFPFILQNEDAKFNTGEKAE